MSVLENAVYMYYKQVFLNQTLTTHTHTHVYAHTHHRGLYSFVLLSSSQVSATPTCLYYPVLFQVIRASQLEILSNPRARSAKLRAAEKIQGDVGVAKNAWGRLNGRL